MTFSTHIDQLGRSIPINYPPQRIVSLVPSQTELLFDLGLNDEVVGITRYCIHPSSWRSQKTHIGGTKQFDFELIDALQPDLIIGNKEENYKEGIDALAAEYPVWMSDIVTLEDALNMIRSMGAITSREENANAIASTIEEKFGVLKKFSSARVLYLIWRKPWMAVGANTFIDHILDQLGFQNVVEASRYPQLQDEEIVSLNPEVIMLSSEPYPFRGKHAEELKQLLPSAKILQVDGEMFSWYGSRLRFAADYFKTLPL